jgi:DnaJ-domain-containing protein 1
MWYPQILNNMSQKGSDELTEILEARNVDEWAEEAFLAAEEVLVQRGHTPPRPKRKEHPNANARPDTNNRKDSHQERKEEKAKSRMAHAVFTCVFCPTELRIPITEGKYRCPKCQMSYMLRLLSSSPLVYLIAQAEPARTSHQPPPPKREQPKMPTAEVLSAFAVLGLKPSSTLIEARANYRKIIQSYHPDKVSHLGKELKDLAELKTKELNEAISIITSFFEST